MNYIWITEIGLDIIQPPSSELARTFKILRGLSVITAVINKYAPRVVYKCKRMHIFQLIDSRQTWFHWVSEVCFFFSPLSEGNVDRLLHNKE